MKIGMLSQWYDPEPGPAAIPGVLAREFARKHHKVSVLTGFPNYPEGKLYPGYAQRARQISEIEGVQITRVPLYPNHSSSSIGRVLNYSSFAASATAFGGSALRGVDAVWVYNSPITVGLPLLAHTRGGRTPFFLHVQDLWPDSLIESGMFPGGRVGAAASSVINRLVRLTERRAGVIGVISPSVRDLILSRAPSMDPSKVVYVPNPTDESLFRPLSALGERAANNGEFHLMYVGAIGEVQGLDVLLDAATLLRAQTGIKFTIVGDGIARERLQRRVEALGLKSVHFLGRIPKQRVPETMAGADAQLVSLAGSEFLRMTTPSKIPSLLASEVPIIGQIAGDGAKLLTESGAAIAVDPGNTEGLAEAVTAMAQMSGHERAVMAARGRDYYQNHLSAAVAAETIMNSLRGLVDNV